MQFEHKIHNLPVYVEYSVDRFGEIELADECLRRVQLGFGGFREPGDLIPMSWMEEFFSHDDWYELEEEARIDYQGVLVDQGEYYADI